MKVLTLNCGSSSVKFSLWEMPSQTLLCSGIVERVSLENSLIKYATQENQEKIIKKDCPNHEIAIKSIIEILSNSHHSILSDMADINAVGHRVVHGGEKFTQSVIIDNTVIKTIKECCKLAPLHNPPNLKGIKVAMELMPAIPHIAVFDTAFLSSMPPHVYVYPLPYEWYEKDRIRKYGFHGTSHSYVTRRAAKFLRKDLNKINLITLHIGNGVSVTAVKKGRAYDHSMGFTPLEGAIMGTRCGDIDPAIPLVKMQEEKISPEEMSNILNKKSGLLGITGKYVDRRDIITAAEENDERAHLALEMECYRLKKYIGAYYAALGNIDAIVFTGGVGENSWLHRWKICNGLESIGLTLSEEKNKNAKRGEEVLISPESSKIKVLVIPTNEELVIAEDVVALLNKAD
ncbi:acetate kinase [[Eubacterium] cellulosolvens]